MADNKLKDDNALLQVRIPRPLREEFMRLVKQEDDNASRLVRQWIREYMRERAQSDLFEDR
jgi:metal-responsive CopG/Arc/MetJ family transcriptional regulator